MFIWLVFAALDARAGCTPLAMYTLITVEYSDGTKTYHWEFDGWAYACTSEGGDGYYAPSGPSGGGSVSVPPGKIDQRNEYNNCPDRPLRDYSELLDRTGFTATGLGSYVPWEDFKNVNADYVMVSRALGSRLQCPADGCLWQQHRLHRLPTLERCRGLRNGRRRLGRTARRHESGRQ